VIKTEFFKKFKLLHKHNNNNTKPSPKIYIKIKKYKITTKFAQSIAQPRPGI
jgi:hypothetical protein